MRLYRVSAQSDCLMEAAQSSGFLKRAQLGEKKALLVYFKYKTGKGLIFMNIENFWQDVLRQDPNAIRGYFDKYAVINWHNTNEQFNAEEFIRANCEYPGKWGGKVERIETIADLIITVTHVWAKDKQLSFHATSFIRIEQEKIVSIDEYWGDDGSAPEWRRSIGIGRPIHGQDTFSKEK